MRTEYGFWNRGTMEWWIVGNHLWKDHRDKNMENAVHTGVSSFRLSCLKHRWGRGKIPAISQTTLSNALSWMKMYECRLGFHWNLDLWFQLAIFQHWRVAWSVPSHCLNQWWLVYLRIYALVGLNELMYHLQSDGYVFRLNNSFYNLISIWFKTEWRSNQSV